MNQPTQTVACATCGEDFEVPAHVTATDGIRCERCNDRRIVDELLSVIRGGKDPDDAWVHNRAEAIMRIAEYVDLPIQIADGHWLVSANVEHGRGIGAEPDGYWVEKSEYVVERDCPECGYPMAREFFKANAGHHHIMIVECDLCGHVHDEHV